MYQPATEEGLTQNSGAVGCLFLARATSFNSAWALTHPFPDSPVLSFQPVLGGLTGIFWAIVMYQDPTLLQTWFYLFIFLGGGHSPQVPSDPQQNSLWILSCSSNQVQQQSIPTPWRIISDRRTLFQKSWSSSPGQAGLHVSASLSLLPWDTLLSGYTGTHSLSNSAVGACCGFSNDIWEILESSCNISLLLGRTGLDGQTRACQQFFWTSTTCSLFSRHSNGWFQILLRSF